MSQTQTTRSNNPSIDWPLITFFALAYIIAWGMIPILGAIARQSGVADWATLSQMGEAFDFGDAALAVPGWLVYLITRLQDFAFSIAGLIMIGLVQGREGYATLGKRLIRWRFKWYWYVAALLPAGLYFVATLVAGGLSSFRFSSNTLFTILFSFEAGFLVYLFLRGAMGEELGLRGFALPRLQSYTSPFRASLVIGILWGAWHLPVLIRQNVVTAIAFLLLALGLSFTFTFLFNRTGGSLIPGLLFHAAQNAEEIFETVFPTLVGTEWELVSTLGLLLVGITAGVLVWRSTSHATYEE